MRPCDKQNKLILKTDYPKVSMIEGGQVNIEKTVKVLIIWLGIELFIGQFWELLICDVKSSKETMSIVFCKILKRIRAANFL